MSYDNYDSFKNSDEGRREGDGSSANRSGSGRPRFVKHTRPAYSGREEGRRPYGDNARPYGERRPYGGNSGEARPFNAENRFNKRPYGANSSYEGRRPYGARPAKEQYGEERRPYGERPYGERPYGERRPYGEGRPARSEQQGGGNRYEGGTSASMATVPMANAPSAASARSATDIIPMPSTARRSVWNIKRRTTTPTSPSASISSWPTPAYAHAVMPTSSSPRVSLPSTASLLPNLARRCSAPTMSSSTTRPSRWRRRSISCSTSPKAM